MMVTNLITGILCIFIGVVLKVGKTVNIVAGYNTLPTAEKEKYDIDKLSNFTGWQCIISGAIMLVSALVMLLLPFDWIGIVAWILFTIVILGGVTYGNKSKYYLK